MTRALLLVVVAAAVVAAVIGSATPLAAAVVGGLAVGGAASVTLWSIHRRRLESLATSLNQWLGTEQREPIDLPDSPAWQELAVAVNALGAAFDRRGRRLRRAREQRTRLVDAIDEPALLFGSDGRLVHANTAAREHFGVSDEHDYTPGQALGSSQLAGAVAEARETQSSVTVDVTVMERELTGLAAPVGHEILFLVSDRSERRLVDAVRRDFVANASHELKTPASGIQALAEALVVTIERDEERAVALATRLADEAGRLGKLVHDLLDLRRLEERGEPGRAPVDLVEIVRREVGRRRDRAAQRDISFDLHVPDRAVVAGSREDLRLVVANLLENAVGYNRRGGRVVAALRRVDGAWELEVQDTGIGIARQDLDRVFERFYRVDVARSRAAGGTGLGLSIVRHAVERHGGAVRVDSILGEGTSFTVSLPVEPPA